MRKRRYKSSPRVKIQDNGRCTLAGMYYGDLQQILTKAALECYDALKPGAAKKAPDMAQYAKTMLVKIDAVSKAIDLAITATYPQRHETRDDRWQKVKEERRTRILIDSIIDEHIRASK